MTRYSTGWIGVRLSVWIKVLGKCHWCWKNLGILLGLVLLHIVCVGAIGHLERSWLRASCRVTFHVLFQSFQGLKSGCLGASVWLSAGWNRWFCGFRLYASHFWLQWADWRIFDAFGIESELEHRCGTRCLESLQQKLWFLSHWTGFLCLFSSLFLLARSMSFLGWQLKLPRRLLARLSVTLLLAGSLIATFLSCGCRRRRRLHLRSRSCILASFSWSPLRWTGFLGTRLGSRTRLLALRLKRTRFKSRTCQKWLVLRGRPLRLYLSLSSSALCTARVLPRCHTFRRLVGSGVCCSRRSSSRRECPASLDTRSCTCTRSKPSKEISF